MQVNVLEESASGIAVAASNWWCPGTQNVDPKPQNGPLVCYIVVQYLSDYHGNLVMVIDELALAIWFSTFLELELLTAAACSFIQAGLRGMQSLEEELKFSEVQTPKLCTGRNGGPVLYHFCHGPAKSCLSIEALSWKNNKWCMQNCRLLGAVQTERKKNKLSKQP
jgi:hypothetical protein